MKRVLALLLFISGLFSSVAYATVYNVNSSMSAATINSTATTAAGSSGNSVVFAAGTYSLSSQLSLPCTNGVVYTGPTVSTTIGYTGTASVSPNGGFTSKIVIGNLPTALIEVSGGGYAVTVASNGTSNSTAGTGCTYQYLNFPTTEGGFDIHYPSSGVLLQYNVFQNNNPSPNYGSGGVGNSAMYFEGQNLSANGTASNGTSHDKILWNIGLNNCYAISQAMYSGAPSNGGDNGGNCNFVHLQSYNNDVEIANNTVAGTEEGVKVYLQTASWTSQYNFNMHDNNMSAAERILIEDQQSSDGKTIVSHNSFYEPWYPWALTFEVSVPLYQCSTGTCGANNSPASTMNDNIIIDNETITETGSGAHLGPGIEQWGAGAISQYNVLQGGNGTGGTCGGHSNGPCLGFTYSIGEAFTNANDQYNYFSGTDTWNGTANNTGKAFAYEDGASSGNAGLNLANSTVVQVSATLPTAVPVISQTSSNVTIAPPDVNHHYSIFYTTDGSTPAIFGPNGSAGTTTLYTGPFTPSNGATVKAIAQWGQGANQGIVFPYFGPVPSSVVSATYTGSGGGVTLSSIAISGTSTTIAGSTPFALVATGTYSNSTTANISSASTWSSNNTAVCTVSGSTVTPIAAGTCGITAVDGEIASSPIFTITVSAPVETNAIQSTTPVNGVNTMTVGGSTLQFQTIGIFNNGTSSPVTASSYASSNTAVCTVTSPGGLVTAVAAGTCNISSVSGSSITSSYWTVTVSTATLVSMSVAANSSTLQTGAVEAATATGTFSDGSTPNVVPGSWNSNNTAACTISSAGIITAVAPGVCNITAVTGAITSTPFTVTVSNPSPALVSLAIFPSLAYATGPFSFSLVGTYSDGSVSTLSSATWTSSNTAIATVTSGGSVATQNSTTTQGSTIVSATVGNITATAIAVVSPNQYYKFPANSFSLLFQNLSIGTYTLVVNADGTFTITP